MLCALTVCGSFVYLSLECAGFLGQEDPSHHSTLPPSQLSLHLLIFSRCILSLQKFLYSIPFKHMLYNSLFIWCPQWMLGSIRATREKGTILFVAYLFMIFQYSLNIHGVFNTWTFWLLLKWFVLFCLFLFFCFFSIKWFDWLFSSWQSNLGPNACWASIPQLSCISWPCPFSLGLLALNFLALSLLISLGWGVWRERVWQSSAVEFGSDVDGAVWGYRGVGR